MSEALGLFRGGDDGGELEGDLALQRNLNGHPAINFVCWFAVGAYQVCLCHSAKLWLGGVGQRHPMVIYQLCTGAGAGSQGVV